jgi:hypothetical protein
LETAKQRKVYEQDRQALRQMLLKDMKRYYGHEKWNGIEALEDVELYDRDRSLMCYLNRLVLYGEPSKRKSRYVDRSNQTVEKSAFRRRPLGADDSKEERFFIRLKDKLTADFPSMRI